MRFDLIYADPPWKYNNPQDYDPARGGMPYPPLDIDSLCSLRLSDICNKDALLFSWATAPKLEEGIRFVKDNGFEYCTVGFIWVKLNKLTDIVEIPVDGKAMPDVLFDGGLYSGTGYYTNSQVEYVLIGRKGKMLERLDKKIKQIVFAPVGAHSSKPDEVRRRIDSLVGVNNKKLEIFARMAYKEHAEWPSWVFAGNEVCPDNLDIREALERIKNDSYLD